MPDDPDTNSVTKLVVVRFDVDSFARGILHLDTVLKGLRKSGLVCSESAGLFHRIYLFYVYNKGIHAERN